MSGLRAGTPECQIRSVPVLALPRLQRFSITLKRRQRAKINIILALCQQSENPSNFNDLHLLLQRRQPPIAFSSGSTQ
ncbi:hypothetical protein FZC68_09190 [Bacillus pumilus]|uniref:Uncharacterized protein n=1 Tax=Bacillus pumilus TaxID=1408 RepID=A0AAD0HNK9_BACPU|nr:hypothetical protein C5695_11910 [Bacillus pumilus]TYS33865.1 hypothetical protein FZC65_05155 [Bacillus pumilus]TYS42583.1 hypothetical protein FZC68_09190 [Bacillus pumilus]TYS48918.1 hypothetical protein FZC67_07660 [Bacillus pumilus]